MTISNDILRSIGVSMTERALKYLTPVLLQEGDGSASLVGTGTYVDIDGQLYLLTCDHVTKFGKKKPLLVLLRGQDESIPGPNDTIVKQPEDLSFGRIPDTPKLSQEHNSAGLHLSSFACRHQPVEGEILFFLGTPGEDSEHIALLETTFVSAEPRLVSEVPRFARDPLFVFCLPHQPAMAINVEGGTDRQAQNPEGFSGALVWNTRYIECARANRPWSPRYAQVTGMLRRWDSGATHLTCCRSEGILSFINTVLGSDPTSFPLE
jgi:hypothetical protein